MAYYVIHPDGSRYGPAELPTLQQWIDEGRIGEHTLIENEETGRALEASLIAGLSFGPKAPTPPPLDPLQGSYAQPPTYGGYERQRSFENVDNHLVKAILSTICCCLPLGVVSIVYAAQVDGFARSGDSVTAHDMAEKADLWSNWAIGLGLLADMIYFVLVLATGGMR